MDDHVPDASGEYHEVNQWIELNWLGWRLIEWDLGADSLGAWIGNGLLEGLLRIDSFQLTHNLGGAPEGRIFFDNFRIVTKTTLATEPELILPENFVLYQNYPNPFNPETRILYSLPKPAEVNLSIYDLSLIHISEPTRPY